MKVGGWLLMAALTSTSPAQFQQRSQPNVLLQRQCRVERGGVTSLKEGLSVDFHGRECSRATCHYGGLTEFTECPRVNKTPTNCGNGVFYQKYPHCCDYKYCPDFQNNSTTKWKPFLAKGRYRAMERNSAFKTRQNSWRTKKKAAEPLNTRWNAILKQDKAKERMWLSNTFTNKARQRSSSVRLKRSYSLNYDRYVRTMQLYNGPEMGVSSTGVGLQIPPNQPTFINDARKKVSDLVGSAIQAVFEKMFGRSYDDVGQAFGEQTSVRQASWEKLRNAIQDKMPSANTAGLRASTRQAGVGQPIAEQLVDGSIGRHRQGSALGAKPPEEQLATEHPTVLLARQQEARKHASGIQEAGRNPMQIIEGDEMAVGESHPAVRHVVEAGGQIIAQGGVGMRQLGEQRVRILAGGRTSVIGDEAPEIRTGRYIYEEPIIEDAKTSQRKATGERRSGTLGKNEQVPSIKAETTLAVEVPAKKPDDQITFERKQTEKKYGEEAVFERRRTSDKDPDLQNAAEQPTGGRATDERATGGEFTSETTTTWKRTGGRARGRGTGGRRAGGGGFRGGRGGFRGGRGGPRGWQNGGAQTNRARGWETNEGRAPAWQTGGGRSRNWQTGGGRTIGGRERGWQSNDGRSRGWRDNGGRGAGGRGAGGRGAGGRGAGWENTGGRGAGGRGAGWENTGGRGTGWGNTGGRDAGGQSRGWRTNGNFGDRGRAFDRTGRGRWAGGRDNGRWAAKGRATQRWGNDEGGGYRQQTNTRRVGDEAVDEFQAGGAVAPEEEVQPNEVPTIGKKKKGKKARRLVQAEKARLENERKAARWRAAKAQTVPNEEIEEVPTPVMVAEGLVKPAQHAPAEEEPNPQAKPDSSIPTIKAYKARKEAARRRKAKKQVKRQRKKEHRAGRRKSAESCSDKSDETFYLTSSEAKTNDERDPVTDAQMQQALQNMAKKAFYKTKSNHTKPTMLGNIGAKMDKLGMQAQRVRKPTNNPNRRASADLTFKDLRDMARDQRTKTYNEKRSNHSVEKAAGKSDNGRTTMGKQPSEENSINIEYQDTSEDVDDKFSKEAKNSKFSGNKSINMEKQENGTSKYRLEDTSSQSSGNSSINNKKPVESVSDDSSSSKDTKSEYSSHVSITMRKSLYEGHSTTEKVRFKQIYTKDWYKHNAESRYRKKYERKMAMKKKNKKHKKRSTSSDSWSTSERRSSESLKRKIEEKSDSTSSVDESEDSGTIVITDSEIRNATAGKKHTSGLIPNADMKVKRGPSLRELKERSMAARRKRKRRRKRRKQLFRRRLKENMNRIRNTMGKITFNETAVVIEKSNATNEAKPTVSPTRKLQSSKEYQAILQARRERRRLRRNKRRQQFLASINKGRNFNRTVIGKMQMVRNSTQLEKLEKHEYNNGTVLNDEHTEMYGNGTALEKQTRPASSSLEHGRPFGLFRRDYMTPEEIEARRISRRERRKLKRKNRRKIFAGRKLHETKLKREKAKLKQQQRDEQRENTRYEERDGRYAGQEYREDARRGVGQEYRTESGYGRQAYGEDTRGRSGKYARGKTGGYDGGEGGQYVREGYDTNARENGRNAGGYGVSGGGVGGGRVRKRGNRISRGEVRVNTRVGTGYMRQEDGYMTIDSRYENQGGGYGYDKSGQGINVDEKGYKNSDATVGEEYGNEIPVQRESANVDGITPGEHYADEGGGSVDGQGEKNVDATADYQGRGGENIDEKGQENVGGAKDGYVDGKASGGYPQGGGKENIHESDDDRKDGDVGGPRTDGKHDDGVSIHQSNDDMNVGDRQPYYKSSAEGQAPPLPHDTSKSIPTKKHQEQQSLPSPGSHESSPSLSRKQHSRHKRVKPISNESSDNLPKRASTKQKPSEKQVSSLSQRSSENLPRKAQAKQQPSREGRSSPPETSSEDLVKNSPSRNMRFENQGSGLGKNSSWSPYGEKYPKEPRKEAYNPSETFYKKAFPKMPRARGAPIDRDSPQQQTYHRNLRGVRERYARGMSRYKKKLTPKQMLLRQRVQAHRAKIKNRHKSPLQLKLDARRRMLRREKIRKIKNRKYPITRKGKTKRGKKGRWRKKNKIYRRHT